MEVSGKGYISYGKYGKQAQGIKENGQAMGETEEGPNEE